MSQQSVAWYQDKRFDKYWKHYQSVFAWLDAHKASQKCIAAEWQQYYTRPGHKTYSPHFYTEPRVSNKFGNSKRKSKPKQSNSRKRHKTQYPNEVDDNGSDANDGDSIFCDITDDKDLRDFLIQSAKHRQQRDKQKRERDKKSNNDEDLGKFDESVTSAPPKEQAGSRRTAEMKELYGAGAAMIHGMETAMQLTFDRNCDIMQPKLWPNLPLDMKFG